MAGSTVVVSVLADSAKFKRDMDDIGQSTNKLTGFLGGIGKALGVALLAGTVALGAFLGASFKAVAEIERLNAQTSAVIQSTAGAAGRSLDQLNSYGQSLERLTGIEAETIQAGQNLLLTFTNIKGDNFDKATEAALNLSTAMGTDMTSAATLVGKALNDPIGGISALSRVGVQLTDSQKATIQSMVELGDVAGAQAVILGELNTQFGGSAEAFGNTFLGSVEKVKNSFGDLGESLVSSFLPVATDALLKLNDLFLGIAESPMFQAIVAGISEFAAGLLEGGMAAGQFGEIFQVVMAFLNPFGLVIQALAPILPTLADSFILLATSLGGALMGVLPAVAGLLNTLVSVLSGVLATILPVVIGLVIQLADIFAELAPVIAPIITMVADLLADALVRLMPIISLLAETIGEILGVAFEALAPLLTTIIEVIIQVLDAVSPLIDVVLTLVEALAPLLPIFGDLIAALLPPVIELLMALLIPILELVSPLLDLLVPAIQFLADVLAAIVGVIAGVLTAFIGLITGSSEAQAQVSAIWQGVLDFFGGIPAAIGAFFASAGTWLVEAGGNIVDGLLAGLTAAFDAVWNFIEDAAQNIADTFADVLGIASPSRVFKSFGQFTVQGLALGLRDLGPVDSAMSSLSSSVANGFDTPTFDTPTPSAGSAREIHIHLDGQVFLTQAEVGRAIRDALEEYDRLNGQRA